MTTDNKTLAVDVLAEMEQAHATLKGLAYASELTGDHIQADAMKEARAAVAELIAADEEYNRAREAWLASPALHEEFQATRDAWRRRATSLARVKGESA